jgi:hypothetical protein
MRNVAWLLLSLMLLVAAAGCRWSKGKIGGPEWTPDEKWFELRVEDGTFEEDGWVLRPVRAQVRDLTTYNSFRDGKKSRTFYFDLEVTNTGSEARQVKEFARWFVVTTTTGKTHGLMEMHRHGLKAGETKVLQSRIGMKMNEAPTQLSHQRLPLQLSIGH